MTIILGDGELQLEDRAVLALYMMFSSCPPERLNEDFPVDILLGYLE